MEFLLLLKNYKNILIFGILFTLGGIVYFQYKENKKLVTKYETTMANYKASVSENSLLKESNREYSLTAQQLGYYNDSLLVRLDSLRKSLKIKDKQLLSIQHYSDEFSKKDTLYIKDTIFEKNIDIDTIIGDNFYTLHLGLKYPNRITTDPKFTNDKDVFIHTTKETVEPPKKFFLLRWFQKKQSVVIVDVLDTNPYITTKNKRFIKIIK